MLADLWTVALASLLKSVEQTVRMPLSSSRLGTPIIVVFGLGFSICSGCLNYFKGLPCPTDYVSRLHADRLKVVEKSFVSVLLLALGIWVLHVPWAQRPRLNSLAYHQTFLACLSVGTGQEGLGHNRASLAGVPP